MHVSRAVAALFALMLLGSAFRPVRVWGQDDKAELLRFSKEVKEAERKARYEAEQMVYDFSGKGVQCTRFLVQVAYPNRKRQSISGPEQNRCTLLEDGRYLWSYFPSRKVVVKEPMRPTDGLMPENLPQTMQLILRNYRFSIRGPVPLRGRTCRILEFQPHWKDRPRREIWLEEETKIPLSVSISYPDGRPVYRSELDKIRWNPAFDPDTFHLRVPKDTKVYEIQKQENLSVEEAEALLHHRMGLPPFSQLGYTPYNIILRSAEGRRRLQVVFTDGLSSFSIFREWFVNKPESEKGAPPEPEQASEKSRSLESGGGSVSLAQGPFSFHRYGLINVVTLENGDQRTICVGDIIEERLKEIAHSLGLPRPRSESSSERTPDSVSGPDSRTEKE